jgi:hypothetical protein
MACAAKLEPLTSQRALTLSDHLRQTADAAPAATTAMPFRCKSARAGEDSSAICEILQERPTTSARIRGDCSSGSSSG